MGWNRRQTPAINQCQPLPPGLPLKLSDDRATPPHLPSWRATSSLEIEAGMGSFQASMTNALVTRTSRALFMCRSEAQTPARRRSIDVDGLRRTPGAGSPDFDAQAIEESADSDTTVTTSPRPGAERRADPHSSSDAAYPPRITTDQVRRIQGLLAVRWASNKPAQ